MKVDVIYVSSNKEDREFEKKTREDLKKKVGELKIISVTQKPVELGTNICVGDVGASGFNFCRQNLIALEWSDADVVITAESDSLYSPDYFEFRPERLDIPYRNTNIYVQHYNHDYFFKKDMSTFSQVVGRKFYRDRLRYLLKDQPKWSTEMKNFPKEINKKLFDEFETFETKYPCLSFKTGKGMRKYTPSERVPVHELPYWGKSSEVIKEYCDH